MNKKILIAAFVVLAAAVIVFSVVKTSSKGSSDGLKDGVYFAQQTEYAKSGWRYQVVVTVKDSKISAVNWNGVSNIGGAIDKKAWSKMGKYGMKDYATQGEWDVQAEAVEAYLLKTQDLGFNKFDNAGKTDAITGATITVTDFYDLVNKAIKSPAVAKGAYAKDGWYYAEEDDFGSSGWKDTGLVTVVNGRVVDIVWNSISKDPNKKSKLVEAVEGRYGMEKIATKGEWHVQAKAVEEAIVKAGDPAKIQLAANGKADAVTGATITANVVPVAIKALESAR